MVKKMIELFLQLTRKAVCSKLSFYMLLFFIQTYAQNYPIAPEIWSSPELIMEIDQWALQSQAPSIDWSSEKLYFEAGYISVVEKTNSGWGTPITLSSNVNKNLARTPCISPNGKRLFFSWYVGSWDLYYSDWDSITNDWGPAKSCGLEVNSPYDAEIGCSLPDDTTLIFLRNGFSFISIWDKINKKWGKATGFPIPELEFSTDWGIYLSPNMSKLYHTLSRRDTIDGVKKTDQDIYVSYKDTSFTRGYTLSYILNIFLESDSLFKAGEYISRIEGYPTLTPDGKTMYFMADYMGDAKIYVSHLLVDENGNPVSLKRENRGVPASFILENPYPNPFNSLLKVKYQLNEDGVVRLSVYDLFGRVVATLVDERLATGRYEVEFNIENNSVILSSGIYYLILSFNEKRITKKVVYLK